jgi:hypothetical protein
MYLTPVGTTTFEWVTPSDTSPVYGPVVNLSEVLKLSRSQAIRIQAIQQQTQQMLRQEQQTAEKNMDTLFREIQRTQQQKAGWVLPFSDPVSQQVNRVLAPVVEQITLPQREQRMRSLFGDLTGVASRTPKQLKQIEQMGSDEIKKVLDESQQAALPRLLAGMSVFRRLSFLPAERYVTLDLSEDQRHRLSVLAQQVINEQRRGEQERAAPDQLRSSQLRSSMTPQQRRRLHRLRLGDYVRLVQETHKAYEQVRRKARREALSVLTPAQRHTLEESMKQPRVRHYLPNMGSHVVSF